MSFADFTNNPNDIVFVEFGHEGAVDGWRRPLLYRPYNATLGDGSVLSLGMDGKLGGTGAAADIEMRFGERISTNNASPGTSESAAGGGSSAQGG